MAVRDLTTVADTKAFAATLAPHLRPADVLLLSGDLGAGKTQFTQGLAAALGVSADVTSPTFNILLEYHDGRLPLYHFDLYRLDDDAQLEDIDYFGVLEDDGVSVVEWGDKFPDSLPDDYVELTFRVGADAVRHVEAVAHGARSCELLDAWEGGA